MILRRTKFELEQYKWINNGHLRNDLLNNLYEYIVKIEDVEYKATIYSVDVKTKSGLGILVLIHKNGFDEPYIFSIDGKYKNMQLYIQKNVYENGDIVNVIGNIAICEYVNEFKCNYIAFPNDFTLDQTRVWNSDFPRRLANYEEISKLKTKININELEYNFEEHKFDIFDKTKEQVYKNNIKIEYIQQ